MGAFKKAMDGIGYALTLQTIFLFLFPAGVFVVLGVYLASLTALVRLFAPLSYLFVAFFVVIFFLWIWLFALTAASRLGWKPSPRGNRRITPKNAPFPDVIKYLLLRSAFGSKMHPDNEPAAVCFLLEREIMDRLGEGTLEVWGRTHHGPLVPISSLWTQCAVNVAKQEITETVPNVITSMTRIYYDIHFNWRQVKRTWPKANPLMRRLRKWAFENQTKGASTPC